jgi:hypothetical protein
VAEAQVQVPEVSFEVVDAVRIDHADGRAGEIVVQRLFGIARVEAANAKQQSQKFLVFGVDADDGIGGVHELVAVGSDDLKLPIATSVFSQRQRFAGLATAQAVSFQELCHDGNTDAKAHVPKFLSNLRT